MYYDSVECGFLLANNAKDIEKGKVGHTEVIRKILGRRGKTQRVAKLL